MNKKLKREDELFSKFIRLRDGSCVNCGQPGSGPLGIDGLECSHFFKRRFMGTRFHPANCDALCNSCHQTFEVDRAKYTQFKINQLGGTDILNSLRLKSLEITKRSQSNFLQEIKTMLKTLEGGATI